MIEISDIFSAWKRIRPHLHLTPVLTSEKLDAATKKRIFLKAESLQKTGSFKSRGALHKALLLDSPKGLVAASSGNHAQGVAFAAGILGVPAAIVVPEDTVPVKKSAIRGYGAELIDQGVTVENREAIARQVAAERGWAFIHPFDDEAVMAGQGTVGLELLHQVPDLDAVLVPVGGGGLIAGIATAVKALAPGVKVIGVEPGEAADAVMSFARGTLVRLERAPETVADGVRTMCLGEKPFAVIKARVDAMLSVSEAAILKAQRLILSRAKLVAEPTGALPLAAVLEHAETLPERLGLVISGGNWLPQ